MGGGGRAAARIDLGFSTREIAQFGKLQLGKLKLRSCRAWEKPLGIYLTSSKLINEEGFKYFFGGFIVEP